MTTRALLALVANNRPARDRASDAGTLRLKHGRPVAIRAESLGQIIASDPEKVQRDNPYYQDEAHRARLRDSASARRKDSAELAKVAATLRARAARARLDAASLPTFGELPLGAQFVMREGVWASDLGVRTKTSKTQAHCASGKTQGMAASTRVIPYEDGSE